jgi:hypothetical protein
MRDRRNNSQGEKKMKKLILFSCLLLATGQIIYTQQSDFPKLTGP